MESEFIALELASSEAKWLKNVLAEISLGVKPTPSIQKHCDFPSDSSHSKNYNI